MHFMTDNTLCNRKQEFNLHCLHIQASHLVAHQVRCTVRLFILLDVLLEQIRFYLSLWLIMKTMVTAKIDTKLAKITYNSSGNQKNFTKMLLGKHFCVLEKQIRHIKCKGQLFETYLTQRMPKSCRFIRRVVTQRKDKETSLCQI